MISKAFSSLLLCLLIFPLPSALPAKIRQRAADEVCCARGAPCHPARAAPAPARRDGSVRGDPPLGIFCHGPGEAAATEGRVCPLRFQVYLSTLMERVVPTEGDSLRGSWPSHPGDAHLAPGADDDLLRPAAQILDS